RLGHRSRVGIGWRGGAAMRRAFAVATMVASLSTGSASAVEQELEPIPSEPPVVLTNPTEWPFDLSFGVSATTNYVSRGITNSGNDPAVQGYVEPSIGPVYFNLWSSNVNFGDGF